MLKMLKKLNFVFIFGSIFIAAAGQTGDDFSNESKKFIINYYKNPQPDEAHVKLKQYLNSPLFANDDILRYKLAYFFGRAAQLDQSLIDKYLQIFENVTHEQRLFILQTLEYCEPQQTAGYFKAKLQAGRYAKERAEIQWLLDEGRRLNPNILESDVKHPADLEILMAEFHVTGNEKAIVKSIELLSDPNNMAVEPNETERVREYGISLLAYYGKEDKNILKVCKEDLSHSQGARCEVLEYIIDRIDGSISIQKRLAEGKDEKPVTGPKGWALGASALLIERNQGRHNYLSTNPINEYNIKAKRKLLEEWWGVESREGLLKNMDWLINEGHRDDFKRLGAYLQGLDPNQYQQVLVYYSNNQEKLQEFKIAKEYYQKLGSKGILGWDLCRYICLARWGYLVGYISEEEAWEKIMLAARMLQEAFDSWEDLGQNYLIGRQFWTSEYDEDSFLCQDAYQRLVDMKSSPWNIYTWDMNLSEKE